MLGDRRHDSSSSGMASRLRRVADADKLTECLVANVTPAERSAERVREELVFARVAPVARAGACSPGTLQRGRQQASSDFRLRMILAAGIWYTIHHGAEQAWPWLRQQFARGRGILVTKIGYCGESS
ncbi:MAG: hypothetical protein ACT4NY_05875 [Pseudonocardiales bacterium]